MDTPNRAGAGVPRHSNATSEMQAQSRSALLAPGAVCSCCTGGCVMLAFVMFCLVCTLEAAALSKQRSLWGADVCGRSCLGRQP